MIRLAENHDKLKVNGIRKQVQLLHASERSDIFRTDFCSELADRFDYFLLDEDYTLAVYEENGEILGFIVMKKVSFPENPYQRERSFLLVEEIGVDIKRQREGIGSQLIDYAKERCKKLGLCRIQLDVWAFNSAEIFYKTQGFNTFRKYMEILV